MRSILLVGILAIAGCAPHLTTLELGDPLPRDASALGEMLMISPGQISQKFLWTNNGVRYALCADNQNRIQFLSTSSTRVATPEGVKVGQTLLELRNIEDSYLIHWRGWGYLVALPSGWNAALFLDNQFLERAPVDTDRVDILFKGTAAGYGS
jgi:hypothetical protein